MNLEQATYHINAYKENNQILEAANYLIRSFGLSHSNFAGFSFRDELEQNTLLLTAEGDLGAPQTVKIPRNLFDFDLNLVLNMIAHEMQHVRQKDPGSLVEDKNEREFQAYYEMLFHKIFQQIPILSPFYLKQFAEKALEYYKRMGDGSALQQKYEEAKQEVENLLQEIVTK